MYMKARIRTVRPREKPFLKRRSLKNQGKVLKENDYGSHGEYVGLDVKAHLENSLKIFKALEEKVERFDYDFQRKCVENRDFEALEMYVMNLLMGIE